MKNADVILNQTFWVGVTPMISDKMIEFGKLGDKITFLNGLDAIMTNKQEVAAKDMERQLLGNGLGTITLVNGAVSASTSVVVDQATLLRPNMVVDIFASIGGAKEASAVTISSVTASTNTVVFASAITCSDDAVICRVGVLDNYPAEGKELTGYQKWVDTTTNGNTYLGVSRVTYPQWQGNVISSATDISHDLLQQLHDRIFKIGGVKPDTLISNLGQYRKFSNTELQKTRYEPGTVKAGVTKLMWGDLTWLRNIDFPLNEVAMLSKSQIKKYQTRDLHLMNEDGNQFVRKSGYPVYEGCYIHYGNVATLKPNAHGRYLLLNEPTF